MGLHVPPGTPDRGPGLETLLIILIVLTTLMTLVRIVSKFVTRQDWWWDDLFALLALPVQLTMLALLLAWRNIGLGLPMEVVAAINPAHLVQGGKYFYVAVFFFDASISFPKMSAIFFYARVFRSNDRALRIHLWVAGSLVTGWFVSSYLTTIFQCTPIPKAWNTTLPGKCIDQYQWYLGTAVLSCLTDFYILLLPIRRIWALQMSRRRRAYLLAAFFLTYSVILLSCGRLAATVQVVPKLNTNITWEMPIYMYWAGLEASISIVCVNVPPATALAKRLLGAAWPLGSTGQSKSRSGTFGHGSAFSKGGAAVSSAPTGRDSLDELVPAAGVANSPEASRDRLGIPLSSIRVQTDIRVDSPA
ncbi:hypothetical protein P170DRAFT_388957 [Aspergillus steynii IBT 23096]|uniref:Rhodopsin domain-containing protein n=1 Tax=Aspergillus steynii IBT 23096 TaxID=1392250 RepID=A0A2I2G3F7_9EURO|nr:uncharacterized protein P170DRAFT_388957 [Aspergillus steynii IBT 23096]PLB47410.1 hypothetical protein P170DRAFT_388957 [Aspergillus steynii IBT 23096]